MVESPTPSAGEASGYSVPPLPWIPGREAAGASWRPARASTRGSSAHGWRTHRARAARMPRWPPSPLPPCSTSRPSVPFDVIGCTAVAGIDGPRSAAPRSHAGGTDRLLVPRRRRRRGADPRGCSAPRRCASWRVVPRPKSATWSRPGAEVITGYEESDAAVRSPPRIARGRRVRLWAASRRPRASLRSPPRQVIYYGDASGLPAPGSMWTRSTAAC